MEMEKQAAPPAYGSPAATHPAYPPPGVDPHAGVQHPQYPPQGQPAYPQAVHPTSPPPGQYSTPPPMAAPGAPGAPPAAHVQPAPGQPGQPGAAGDLKNVLPLQSLGPEPGPVECPNCHKRVVTTTEHEVGDWTHLWALGFYCVTCCCFWIPYVVDSFKDVRHKCSNCGTVLATYKRSGGTRVERFA